MKIKKNGEVIRLTESDLKRIVKRVLTEQDKSEIDKNGITIGDITIYQGDYPQYPKVKSMGLNAYESGRPNSLSITLSVDQNVKNGPALLQSVLGYEWKHFDWPSIDYRNKSKRIPNRDDIMSMSNLPCTYIAGKDMEKGNAPQTFLPGVTLSFTRQGDSIDLTDVSSYYNCSSDSQFCPNKKEVNDCNVYMTELFKKGFGLPKKISELDPKFISLFSIKK